MAEDRAVEEEFEDAQRPYETSDVETDVDDELVAAADATDGQNWNTVEQYMLMDEKVNEVRRILLLISILKRLMTWVIKTL